MRYEVGNRVRIKSLDWYNKHKDIRGNICTGIETFVPEMSQYCGNILTIRLVDEKHKFYLVKECVFAWTDGMIEGPAEDVKIAQDAKTFSEGYNQGYEDGQHDINEWSLPEGFEFTDENGNVINAIKIALKKKKKEYPKTYGECSLINGNEGRIPLKIIGKFTQLINARNAYWKIAGEEMGLGKPWKPDWKDVCQHKHCIYTHGNKITEGILFCAQAILAFPTEEMKSAFKENFDADIEICKELL